MKKLLFLPSAWANEAVFYPQIEEFKKNYDIVTPDLSAHDTIEKMADAITTTFDYVECIVGISMGGLLAQHILINCPSFTAKAIIMGSHAHSLDIDSKNFYLNLIQEVQQGKLEELCQLYTDAVTSDISQQNPHLKAHIMKMPLLVGEMGCVNHHKACLSFSDLTAQLKNIIAKTLIICSREDKATPIEFHKVLHENIPNSELVILQKGGHFLTLEQPDEINWHINRWLHKK